MTGFEHVEIATIYESRSALSSALSHSDCNLQKHSGISWPSGEHAMFAVSWICCSRVALCSYDMSAPTTCIRARFTELTAADCDGKIWLSNHYSQFTHRSRDYHHALRAMMVLQRMSDKLAILRCSMFGSGRCVVCSEPLHADTGIATLGRYWSRLLKHCRAQYGRRQWTETTALRHASKVWLFSLN